MDVLVKASLTGKTCWCVLDTHTDVVSNSMSVGTASLWVSNSSSSCSILSFSTWAQGHESVHVYRHESVERISQHGFCSHYIKVKWIPLNKEWQIPYLFLLSNRAAIRRQEKTIKRHESHWCTNDCYVVHAHSAVFKSLWHLSVHCHLYLNFGLPTGQYGFYLVLYRRLLVWQVLNNFFQTCLYVH